MKQDRIERRLETILAELRNTSQPERLLELQPNPSDELIASVSVESESYFDQSTAFSDHSDWSDAW